MQLYANICVGVLLFIFRTYMLYMINTFEADFILRSRIINNGTQIELVGVERRTMRQIFRFCLSAADSQQLALLLNKELNDTCMVYSDGGDQDDDDNSDDDIMLWSSDDEYDNETADKEASARPMSKLSQNENDLYPQVTITPGDALTDLGREDPNLIALSRGSILSNSSKKNLNNLNRLISKKLMKKQQSLLILSPLLKTKLRSGSIVGSAGI